LKFLSLFWFIVQGDPLQSYLVLKIGLPPVPKAVVVEVVRVLALVVVVVNFCFFAYFLIFYCEYSF